MTSWFTSGPERIRTADFTRARGALYQAELLAQERFILAVPQAGPTVFDFSSSAARSELWMLEVVKSPLVRSMMERATSVSRRNPCVIPSG